MIELDKIYLGDAENILLNNIPDNSIDLVVTSPPYDNLRKYNGVISTWNHDKFKAIANQLYRVIKDGGVVVWNVNDKVENGSKTLTSFKQALYFQEIGFNINDVMIWCLSGGTNLYVKSKTGVSPMSIKDMVRLNINDIELWDGVKWVKPIGWRENNSSTEKLCITLRSGERLYCTEEHTCVLSNGKEVCAKDLKVNDILKTCILPETNTHNPSILSDDVLWLIGLYIAEGSHSSNTIQLSLCSDELKWYDQINKTIQELGGTATYYVNDNKLAICIHSKVFNAILSQYVGGKTAKDKHLASVCWGLPNEKLKKIIEGYLDGDGHYEEDNDRWRLGFTENFYLERDLRTCAARLNASLTLLRHGSRIKSLNKIYPSLRGEWRWKKTTHYNSKERSEIISITKEKRRQDEKMWDIEIASEEHLFSLASGVLTHNCKTNSMPQVSQPRYTQVFEYMFVFSKGKPKTFNPIKVPCKCAGKIYDSTCKNMGGENGRTHKTFNINNEKVAPNIWEFAVAQNKTKHPAVFPYELPYRHIKTWTNEGDVVLDPFIGSGTTALASIDLKRKYIGIEMSEEYYNICIDRINEKIKSYI